MKLEQLNSSTVATLLNQKSQNRQTSNANRSTETDADTVSLSNQGQIAGKVVQYSLSQHLTINGNRYSGATTSSSSSSSSTSSSTTATDETTTDATDDSSSLFDFKKVAENVLNFVTNAIKSQQKKGASTETLNGMLNQAYEGIDKGFSSAREELDKSGQLSDELSQGIDKSYSLIQDGMSDFEKELFGDDTDAATTDSAASDTTANTTTDSTSGTTSAQTQPDSTSTTAKTKTNHSAQPLSSKEIGNHLLAAMLGQQTASLELVTKEGDKVTISFSDQQQLQTQTSASARKALQAYNANSAANATSAVYSRTSQFSYKVEGDLNANEQKSIAEMMDQIGTLSDSFFHGDISGAVQQAQQLDLSDSELSQLSLNLYQQQALGWQSSGTENATSNSSDSTTASDASSTPSAMTAADLPDFFNQLNDYMSNLQNLFEQLTASFNPDMQTNLQAWVATKQHPEQSEQQIANFLSFNDYLHQVMQTTNDSSQASNVSE